MGFNHEPSIVKSTPQVQALLMSRKVSFPSIILEICGLEVGHIQWERLGGEILPCIMHSMLVCHDYPWLSFGKQLLYDDFETCWNVCFRRKNNLNIIRHEAALQHWIQDRNRTKTLPQKGPRKCEAELWSCWGVSERQVKLEDGLINSQNTAKTNTSCWHESRTPRDQGRYLCSSFFIQACQYPVPAKMDVKEPIGKPQDS